MAKDASRKARPQRGVEDLLWQTAAERQVDLEILENRPHERGQLAVRGFLERGAAEGKCWQGCSAGENDFRGRSANLPGKTPWRPLAQRAQQDMGQNVHERNEEAATRQAREWGFVDPRPPEQEQIRLQPPGCVFVHARPATTQVSHKGNLTKRKPSRTVLRSQLRL